MKNFLLITCLFIIICLLITPISAKQTFNSTLNVTNVTQNTITWHYTYLTELRPIGASLDGVIIQDWKADLVYNYTATDLKPFTTHEFCIFGAATSNCESATTDMNIIDNSLIVILGYTLFFIAIICIIIGLFVPMIAWLGVGFAFMGILEMQHISFWGGFVFMVVALAGIFVAFKDMQGA